MNIYDISMKAGVSIATVSRVLNNSDHVSEETRKRVLDVINENGYVPNAFARGLGLNSMKTIGLLCPDASDPYLARALDYLESNFRTNGFDCLLQCTGYSAEARKSGFEKMKNRHVDGMVLMGSSFIGETDEDISYIKESAVQLPVILLNGSINANGVYCVLCDDENATSEAVSHLIASGKKNILYLYHSSNYSGMKKLNGCRKALVDAGIQPDDRLFVKVEKSDRSISSVCELLQGLHKDGIEFDAVLASEDILAIGALKYAKKECIRVPEELSVIGYNNSVMCLCTEPELSSVDNRLSVICDHIAETMIGVLEGKEKPRKTIFNGELVLRQSTK